MRTLYFIIYTLYFSILPRNAFLFVGFYLKDVDILYAKKILKKCGCNVNIECDAAFGYRFGIEIGNNSGLGKFCRIRQNTIIRDNVMMGP